VFLTVDNSHSIAIELPSPHAKCPTRQTEPEHSWIQPLSFLKIGELFAFYVERDILHLTAFVTYTLAKRTPSLASEVPSSTSAAHVVGTWAYREHSAI
jgi:hypothetical protein